MNRDHKKPEAGPLPDITISTHSTRVNKTGSWKYIRPVYEDRVAPCNQGCPVGIDIEGYMNLVREDRLDDAVDLILQENPLPAVTGRVCYHPCEDVCHRRTLDDAVSIHAVERMLGDRALKRPIPPRQEPPLKERVAVVGSGPAGLSCAYHLSRLGYQVTIFEAEHEPGGILFHGIPEYRLPRSVLAGEIRRIESLGVRIECGVRIGQDIPWSDLDIFDAVFVAVGAHQSRSLGPEFEEVSGVCPGLDLLKEVNAGRLPKVGRRVVVIGGGNTAIDCARTAVRLGAEVRVLYRRTEKEMPANPEEVREARREGVQFEFLTAPRAPRTESFAADDEPLEAIRAMFGTIDDGTPRKRILGLECVRMKLGEPDDSGRPRPVPIEGSAFDISAHTVLTALGEDPDVENLPDAIEPRHAVIPVGKLGETTAPAFFAGGDVIDAPHTVAFAIGSGKRAAVGIDHYLSLRDEGGHVIDVEQLILGETGNVSMSRWLGSDPIRRANPANRTVEAESLNLDHFPGVSRAKDRPLGARAARGGFAEANRGLDDETALAEAGRCFNCGVCNGCELCLIFCPDVAISRRRDGSFAIDYEYCKGCGVCSVECPRGAINMTREGL